MNLFVTMKNKMICDCLRDASVDDGVAAYTQRAI